MKSISTHNTININKLPKLLGNKENAPIKLAEKYTYKNCDSACNSNEIPEFNKFVLSTECIQENTIESKNNGDIKSIHKAITDMPISHTNIDTSNQKRREKVHKDINGINWTSFCIPPKKSKNLDDILKISVKDKTKFKSCNEALTKLQQKAVQHGVIRDK